MSKYTCFVVWVVSLSCVCAGEGVKSAKVFDVAKKGCLKEFGTTEAEAIEAVKTGDVSKINPCYFGCYFKKIGLLTDKGLYDPSIYVQNLKELVKDNNSFFAQLQEVTDKCKSVNDEAVSDGEAGCEMGALVAACLYKEERQTRSNGITHRAEVDTQRN